MAPPKAKRPPTAPGAKPKKLHDDGEALPAPPKEVRPKNMYRKVASGKDEAVPSQKPKEELVNRANLPTFMAAGSNVPLANLSRKELQARAIAAGLKANAKSADIIKALTQMQGVIQAGELAIQGALPKLAANPEERELAELQELGIKGRTPGGTKWRTRAATHDYNLRSMNVAAEPSVEVA